MLVVDAQVHIWANNKPTNPGHRQVPTFSKDDLLKEMDEAGVDAAVIHPPGWDPNSNELAIEAARQHPNRLAILGNFPLDRPESRTRPTLHVQSAASAYLANRWHHRLVVAGSRARRDTRGAGRSEFHPGRRSGCRTPSGATVDH